MKFRIEEFSVSNYRSISKLTIKPTSEGLITICGANNVGKTNFLRALKLFFLADLNEFEPNDDIPFHIVEATRGGGYKTTLKAKLCDTETGDLYSIQQIYTKKQKEKFLEIKGSKNKTELDEKSILDLLEKNFSFYLVEASNIDIPKLISEIVKDDILPAGLVRRAGTQKEALQRLVEFIEKSKEAVSKIENELTALFNPLFLEIDSIITEDWKLKINFPEYSFLREAISSMITFTLFDSNDKELESKGSGIQRIILLSLIQYLNKKSRKKNIVWAIDEPEAFLQPSLQKSLFSQFTKESEINTIFIATHSTFFIDLQNLDNTFLFEGTRERKDEYVRARNKVFYKVDVEVNSNLSSFEKAQKIKTHFGIIKNDAWEIMPFNILVEGQEDKDYITAFISLFNLPIPNILVAGGVPKFSGYLQFINDYCSELKFKPKIFALYDKDSAGRMEFNSLNAKKKKFNNIELVNLYVTRFDGKQHDDIAIEDLIPTNIILDAVNKILKKKKFSKISSTDRDKRNLPVYDKNPVLVFINEMVRLNNTDKYPLSFDSLEMKLNLCVLICKAIESDVNTKKEIKKHSKIKEFIKLLTNSDNK